MTKESKQQPQESVVHHIHHKEELVEDHQREISITGTMATVTISSNARTDTIDRLSKTAKELFKYLKEER
jgi:hypothetical protein